MTVKSQDDLNKPETHSTEVLLEDISKLETTTKEKELLKEILKDEMIKNGERLEEIEHLQKQLDIAVKRIEFLKKKTAAPYYGNNSYLKVEYQMCDKTLRQIEELEKRKLVFIHFTKVKRQKIWKMK